MRALVEAGIALTSELSLDAVLQKLVETAAALTGARYAALGVIDPTGSRLERFVTTGIDAETHARDRRPAHRPRHPRRPHPRRAAAAAARPRPRIRARSASRRAIRRCARSSACPIAAARRRLRQPLPDREGGGDDFTEEDEETVVLLAAQAAVAIENARLYESATRWSAQLESLNEVAHALVARVRARRRSCRLVADRLRELLGARSVADRAAARRRRSASRPRRAPAPTSVLGHVHRRARSKTVRVLERRRSERVDSVLDDPEVDQETARRMAHAHRRSTCRSSSRGDAIGVIAAHDKLGADPRFTDDDLRARRELRRARRGRRRPLAARRARRAAARRRGAGARAPPARARAARRDRSGADLDPARAAHDRGGERRAPSGARRSTDVRELVRRDAPGRPPARGRAAAEGARRLRPRRRRSSGSPRRFGEQTGIAVEFQSTLPRRERLPPEIETALYRIVQEALTNIVKHARARRVSIVARPQGRRRVGRRRGRRRRLRSRSDARGRARPRRHARACRAARRPADDRVAAGRRDDVRRGGAADQ